MNIQHKTTKPQDSPRRSLAEWITFSIAAAILSTVIGLVSYVWLGKERQPPVFSIKTENTIREVDGQFYVPFSLINKGGETVESVRVAAELEINSSLKERGEQEIDFLSSGEVQEGAFIFSTNPEDGKLKLKVESYKLP